MICTAYACVAAENQTPKFKWFYVYIVVLLQFYFQLIFLFLTLIADKNHC